MNNDAIADHFRLLEQYVWFCAELFNQAQMTYHTYLGYIDDLMKGLYLKCQLRGAG